MDTVSKDLMDVVKSTAYPLDAFLFVQRGLDFTVRSIHGEYDDDQEDLEFEFLEPEDHSRHVSGADLCRGLRDLAVQEYGLMATAVLNSWHITACEDFGRIVFAMVDGGLMHKTAEDSLDDFADVLDFEAAFRPRLLLDGDAG